MKRNDKVRRQLVENDEGLYNWWKKSGRGITVFICKHRDEIDAVIDQIESGRKPQHYLAYPHDATCRCASCRNR